MVIDQIRKGCPAGPVSFGIGFDKADPEDVDVDGDDDDDNDPPRAGGGSVCAYADPGKGGPPS